MRDFDQAHIASRLGIYTRTGNPTSKAPSAPIPRLNKMRCSETFVSDTASGGIFPSLTECFWTTADILNNPIYACAVWWSFAVRILAADVAMLRGSISPTAQRIWGKCMSHAAVYGGGVGGMETVTSSHRIPFLSPRNGDLVTEIVHPEGAEAILIPKPYTRRRHLIPNPTPGGGPLIILYFIPQLYYYYYY